MGEGEFVSLAVCAATACWPGHLCSRCRRFTLGWHCSAPMAQQAFNSLLRVVPITARTAAESGSDLPWGSQQEFVQLLVEADVLSPAAQLCTDGWLALARFNSSSAAPRRGRRPIAGS